MPKNKKLLIIYEAPLTENKSGTQNRVINIIKHLKSLGFSIEEFLPYLPTKKEKIITKNELIDNVYFCRKGILSKIFRLWTRLSSHFKYSKNEKLKIEKLYRKPHKVELIKKIFLSKIGNKKYDYVVFVNTSNDYLFDFFKNKKIKKILFMEDVMYNQFRDCRPKNIIEKHFENIKNHEIKVVNQFDKIIGISQAEINLFKNKKNANKFIWLPPFMKSKNIEKKKNYKYDVIYVATNNPHNIQAFNWFLNEVYPKLKKIKILCIGNIYDKIDDPTKYKNIEFIKFIDNLDDAYNNSKIAICPMFTGTGIKIKVVEAMSYGKPVVSNEMGMIGLPSNKNTGCLVTNDAAEFAEYIQDLLNDEKLFEKCSKQTLEYFNKYFLYDKNVKKLDEVFK